MLIAGVAFTLVGVSPASAFGLALVGILVAGASNPLINGPFFAIIQDVVEPEIQGRVFTVVGSLAGIAAPLGMAIAGPLSDRFGVQFWFLLGGIASVVLAIGARAIPAVLHLEDHGRAKVPHELAPALAGEAHTTGSEPVHQA
jgi:MFS transporter, DHA3 family, macrolide efflux protein